MAAPSSADQNEASTTDPSTSPNFQLSSARNIQLSDNVMLKLPTGEIRCVRMDKKGNVNLGRFGNFKTEELIGKPYGLTYEITDKQLKALPPKTLDELEDTDATNELINDDAALVQPLRAEEIETLKQTGVHVSDIIQKQIEQHANYALKTEYSKDKYKKRKEAKFAKAFTPIEPTLFNVCEYWFTKDPSKIRDIRSDTLAQILNLANIRPGGRYLVVDDASGLLVAGILERLGGAGKLLAIADVECPPAFHVLGGMNFSPESTSSVLSSITWASADESYTPILPNPQPSGGRYRSDREKVRLEKRKLINEELLNDRQSLFAGEWEGLIISTQYEPFSVIEKLESYLAGSAPIVVHSSHLQVLTELQAKLKQGSHFLGPSITESWLRQYQVLPGRTHPMMSMPGSGGYILSCIKIYDNPNVSAVASDRRAHRQGMAAKKRKLAAEGGQKAGASSSTQSPAPNSTANSGAQNAPSSREVDPAASKPQDVDADMAELGNASTTVE
ncbi:hypothetical protein BOTBODRAFT_624451 [Botryobasidium botryosum FD-172 SS1]|uniref:tRNA (adenine(58)-N(1))-methyltransferase non-catalytic subunit TRM6 n=1 Tax=Botryobasidium botryosum (strain FD-172 SS1) TaxID=930990 RepID=A0A067MJ59_BOTB1|nr:hypothetical protein BOTBODRAFT_624451 [Botryobasidium botryosum FD-172 SS1]